MIFDTIAAMADWSNDKKFNYNVTDSQMQQVIDDLKNATGQRVSINEITTGR
jgi:uncharacterized protein YlxW (UPF0749 family)